MELLTPYSLSRGAPSASRASLRVDRVATTGPRTTGREGYRSHGRRGKSIPVGFGLARGFGLVAATDALVELFAMDGNVLRRGNADTHLVALYPENRDGDRIADHQGLADAAGQNQHLGNLRRPGACAETPAAARAPDANIRFKLKQTGSMSGTGRPVNRQRSWSKYSVSARTQLGCRPGRDFGQHRDQLRTVRAAALRHVGPPATLAAGTTSDEGHEFPRLDPGGGGTGHAGHERRPALAGTGQHDRRIAQLLAQPVQRVAQRLGIQAFHARGEHLDAGHVDGLRAQV